jgi:hypothetical protein
VGQLWVRTWLSNTSPCSCQRLVTKVLTQAVAFGFFRIVEQILGSSLLDGRQMVVTSAPPGHVIEEAVNVFGDPPAARVLQPPRADERIDIVNAFR